MVRHRMQRILVIRIDFLGDMVCTTPFLHSLKRRWPKAEVHVLANKYNASILDNNPDVDNVHLYVYSKNFSKNVRQGILNYFIDRLKLIWKLRKLRFDMIVIPNGGVNKNSINFARQLNVADCRWHNSETEFDDRNEDHVNLRPMVHEALSGYGLVPEINYPDINQLHLRVFPCKELISKWNNVFKNNGRRKIGLFISNTCPARQWPREKWKILVQQIAVFGDIIVFSSPGEIIPSDWINMSRVSYVSTPTVPELIAVMANMDLTISADSAPVHISSALNIPVVALFESRSEKYLRWYPVGVKNIVIHEGLTVETIPVESVYQATKKIMLGENI